MDQRGFTLLELLVVLAIIGVLLAFVPGFLLRGQPGLDVDVAARAIADALRQARSEAVLQNREQLFALDVEQRLFRVEGQRAPVQIARGIEITFQTARSEAMSECHATSSAPHAPLRDVLPVEGIRRPSRFSGDVSRLVGRLTSRYDVV